MTHRANLIRSATSRWRVAAPARAPIATTQFAGWRPIGRQHAYIRGDTATACALPLAYLKTFPDVPFIDEAVEQRCPVCLRLVLLD